MTDDRPTLSVSEYAKKFDMAVLAQNTPEDAIRTGCENARDYRVAAYYTTPTWTPLVAEVLRGSDVLVGVALAFPYGTLTTRMKLAEIHEALEVGGTALDMVINIGALKSGNRTLVEHEIAMLADLARQGGALSKVIIEVGFLTDEEIRTATRMCVDHGVDYVKTATGSEVLPDVPHLEVMKSALGGRTKMKLSGVPRTFALAATLWMLDMGVELIGTRSAPALVDQYRAHLERAHVEGSVPAGQIPARV
jgi:deoxyribose-phosphate aldolase